MAEKNKGLNQPFREPEEVVESFQLPELREVVETYSRPLPAGMLPPASAPKRRKRGLWIFLLCAVLVGVLAALAYFRPLRVRVVMPPVPPAVGEAEEQPLTVDLPVWEAEKGMTLNIQKEHGPALTPQEIYSQVNPAVVTVEVWLKDSLSVGTGLIFTPDGYLLTNYHVVEGGQRCQVQLADYRIMEALYVAGDRNNDLAVLKIQGEDLPFAPLGDSMDLAVGDPVYAIGNPMGVELRGTFTDGIVSAVERDVLVNGRSMTLIQTNTALNTGNSGGPLINQYGQVVGINTIKMQSNFSNVEGLGFAIPTSTMQYIVDELFAYGKVMPEPRLGISVSTIGEMLPDGTVGVLVQEVTEGGAGWLAGVQVGDYVVEADGDPVTTSGDLLRIRRRFEVGDQMELKLWREGSSLTVTLKLNQAVPEE